VDLQEVRWRGIIVIIWIRRGKGGRLFESGYEPSVSLKFWMFLDLIQVRICWLLRKESIPWI
jgi:hypothetical protein